MVALSVSWDSDSALVLHADKARLFVFSPSMTLGEGHQRTIKVKLDIDVLAALIHERSDFGIGLAGA